MEKEDHASAAPMAAMPTTARHARNAPEANTPTDHATLATLASQVKLPRQLLKYYMSQFLCLVLTCRT